MASIPQKLIICSDKASAEEFSVATTSYVRVLSSHFPAGNEKEHSKISIVCGETELSSWDKKSLK